MQNNNFENFIKKVAKAKEAPLYCDENAACETAFNNFNIEDQGKILQSIIDLRDGEFMQYQHIIIEKFINLYQPDNNDNKELFLQVIERILIADPLQIKSINGEQIKSLNSQISNAIINNPKKCANIIDIIPASELKYFTKAIGQALQQNHWKENKAIFEAIPKNQLHNFREKVEEYILNNSSACHKVIALLPEEEVNNLQQSIKNIMLEKRDKAVEIFSAIPNSQAYNYRDTITELMRNNFDTCNQLLPEIIRKNELGSYVDTIGDVMRLNASRAPELVSNIAELGVVDDFKQKIWRVIVENPNQTANIINSLPEDKIKSFYNAITQVIIDDNQYNRGGNLDKIFNAISESNKNNFYTELADKLLNNSSNFINIINAIPPQDIEIFYDKAANTIATHMSEARENPKTRNNNNYLKILLENIPQDHVAMVIKMIDHKTLELNKKFDKKERSTSPVVIDQIEENDKSKIELIKQKTNALFSLGSSSPSSNPTNYPSSIIRRIFTRN